jgi:hypothetical protein
VMGRHAYTVPDAGISSDLFGPDTAELKIVRENCSRWMSEWILNDCVWRCRFGKCVLQRCVCENMWDGDWCDRQTHTFTAFRVLIAACILMPTIFLICLSLAVWICGSNDDKAAQRAEETPRPM